MRNIYDIEANEIALLQLEVIQEAIVVPLKNTLGQEQLAAYLIAKQEEIDILYIDKAIKQQLPTFITPSYFIWMKSFPRKNYW